MRSELVSWLKVQDPVVFVLVAFVALVVVRLFLVFMEELLTRFAWFGVRPLRGGRGWWW